MSLLGPRDLIPDSGPGPDAVRLPEPIGPLTAFTEAIVCDQAMEAGVEDIVAVDAVDPLTDLDFQRALFCLHQLHDRGVEGAAPDAEWHPVVVEWWHRLAGRFETALRHEVEPPAVVLGAVIPMLGSVARRSQTVDLDVRRDSTLWDPWAWDGPMHRTEVRRHPLAHARVVAAAQIAGTCAPSLDPGHGRATIDAAAASAEMLVACNLTTHLALHRRLLPALLGHLVWHELTSPADPFAGPTNATVADAYLSDRADERPLAMWGADITARVEERLAATFAN